MKRLPKLDGLIAAAHSPFDGGGNLAFDVLEQQAALFREQGLIGVFVGGSTGEWPKLTLDERRSLMDAWSRVVDESLVLIAHVGGVSVEDACSLAAHARTLDVDAISCLVQPGLDVTDAAGVADYLQPVAAAAPDTPLLYYDMEAVTGIDVPLDDVLEEAQKRVPTLAGAKYTNADLATLTRGRCISGDGLQMLMGRDEMLLGALAVGVKGAVGSTYNYAAPVYQRIRRAFAAGDMDGARAANDEAVMFVRELVKVGVLPGAKAIMRWMGVDVGVPRGDGPGPDEAALVNFREAVEGMDIFARPFDS